MRLFYNPEFAKDLIARHTALLSPAAPPAELIFLKIQPEEGGKPPHTAVIRQEITEIHRCIEQNTFVNVELNLRVIGMLVERMVLRFRKTEGRAGRMLARQVVPEGVKAGTAVRAAPMQNPGIRSAKKSEPEKRDASSASPERSGSLLQETLRRLFAQAELRGGWMDVQAPFGNSGAGESVQPRRSVWTEPFSFSFPAELLHPAFGDTAAPGEKRSSALALPERSPLWTAQQSPVFSSGRTTEVPLADSWGTLRTDALTVREPAIFPIEHLLLDSSSSQPKIPQKGIVPRNLPVARMDGLYFHSFPAASPDGQKKHFPPSRLLGKTAGSLAGCAPDQTIHSAALVHPVLPAGIAETQGRTRQNAAEGQPSDMSHPAPGGRRLEDASPNRIPIPPSHAAPIVRPGSPLRTPEASLMFPGSPLRIPKASPTLPSLPLRTPEASGIEVLTLPERRMSLPTEKTPDPDHQHMSSFRTAALNLRKQESVSHGQPVPASPPQKAASIRADSPAQNSALAEPGRYAPAFSAALPALAAFPASSALFSSSTSPAGRVSDIFRPCFAMLIHPDLSVDSDHLPVPSAPKTQKQTFGNFHFPRPSLSMKAVPAAGTALDFPTSNRAFFRAGVSSALSHGTVAFAGPKENPVLNPSDSAPISFLSPFIRTLKLPFTRFPERAFGTSPRFVLTLEDSPVAQQHGFPSVEAIKAQIPALGRETVPLINPVADSIPAAASSDSERSSLHVPAMLVHPSRMSDKVEPVTESFGIPTTRTVTTQKSSETVQKNVAVNLPRQISRPETASSADEAAEISRIAEKVYRSIEARLRSEKMRRGMW